MKNKIEIFKNNFTSLDNGYSPPIDLLDVAIGISIFKDQAELGREDFKSLFRVYIEDKEFERDGDKKPIVVTAVYGKSKEHSLVAYSDDFKMGLNWPVELISTDEFFYNINDEKIYQRNKIISGLDLLNIVNKYHLKPTKLLKGSWYRFKLWCRKALGIILKILFYIISGIQYLFSGKKISFYEMSFDSISPRDENGKKLKIFDYEVEAWVGAVYALIHLSAYLLFYQNNFKPLILMTIFKNSFLTVMYVIISLGALDSILSKLPRYYFTRKLLTFLKEKYFRVAFFRIKI